MNRFLKCIQFQLKNTLKSTLWFLGIYSAIYLFLFLLLQRLVSTSDSGSGSINSGFFFAGAIFIFVIVASNYKSNFNFLLMFGNARKNIFLSTVSVSVVLSLIIAVVSIASQFLDAAFAKELSQNARTNYEDLLKILYRSNVNAATEFLWFLGLYVMIFSLAMLYGAMAYRFGKIFITIFWVGFGFSWTVLPLTVPRLNGTTMYVDALKAYFCSGVSGGILLAPVNFIITAVIFCSVTYVISKRQSQVA